MRHFRLGTAAFVFVCSLDAAWAATPASLSKCDNSHRTRCACATTHHPSTVHCADSRYVESSGTSLKNAAGPDGKQLIEPVRIHSVQSSAPVIPPARAQFCNSFGPYPSLPPHGPECTPSQAANGGYQLTCCR